MNLRVALCIPIAVLTACSGTETGNPPVVDFGNSGCHDASYAQRGSLQSQGLILQSLDQPSEVALDPAYAGLTCMVWDHVDDETVRIRITNYEAACGAGDAWQPKAELRADGTLDLFLEDKLCDGTNCLGCLYDLAFTVRVNEAIDRNVRLSQRGCSGVPSSETKHAVLALSQPNGAVCNYTSSSILHPPVTGSGLRMMCSSTSACLSDLVCTDLGARASTDLTGGSRCLAACSADADCDALSSCQSGVCQLRDRGLVSNWPVQP